MGMPQFLITPEEMQTLEALAPKHGVQLHVLMENAGRAVAAEIVSRYPKRPVSVLCGPGNNGGDGFVVARLLQDLGWPVEVHLLGVREKLKGCALMMARAWTGPVKSLDEAWTGSVIVDALFGIGLSRDFPSELAERAAAAKTTVVAIDVPSGVDALSGETRKTAIKADLTVTFHLKKPAHVLEPSRSLCGEIVVADIGLPPDVISEAGNKLRLIEPPSLPEPARDAHKYSRGGAVIWSGDALHSGAARLAAWAAQRAGAGIVCLAGPRDGLLVQAHHVTSVLLHETKDSTAIEELLGGRKYNACCFGPGAGTTDFHRRIALGMLSSGKKIVLDADAFTLFAKERELPLRMMKQGGEPRAVLTPHAAEFERMFPEIASEQGAPISRARAAARLAGAVVVLKGPATVIASPDGETILQSEAPAKLATAGSGDVLAGLITGLMAQGMAPFAASEAGVWLHTEAARRNANPAMTAEELVESVVRSGSNSTH